MRGQFSGISPYYSQFQFTAHKCGRARAGVISLVFYHQAFLAPGHRQINLSQQFGVQQCPMQRARLIVYLVAVAQGVQAVALAWMQFLRHAQRINNAGTKGR